MPDSSSSKNNSCSSLESKINLKCSSRLAEQIGFIVEIDKLKNILRETRVMFQPRLENDAEHSWHLAMMVMVLSEYANIDKSVDKSNSANPLDIKKILQLVLIHDLVEIDAGDVFSYADFDPAEKHRKECLAADRLFNLLPLDQAKYFRQLWDEYEAQQCIESRFARAIDRLQPFLHNYFTDGFTWRKYNITVDRVKNHILRDMKPGSEILWKFVDDLLDDAVAMGMLLPTKSSSKIEA
ncbi:MAG: HD domain-containing protein [Gammaproteobacteria bacterium]|nr:HD domain-containing protein [Gammaproteobacteria bacterium]